MKQLINLGAYIVILTGIAAWLYVMAWMFYKAFDIALEYFKCKGDFIEWCVDKYRKKNREKREKAQK
jgi:hypothetical protein